MQWHTDLPDSWDTVADDPPRPSATEGVVLDEAEDEYILRSTTGAELRSSTTEPLQDMEDTPAP